jgi:uncharacterized GH25 family protein
MPAAKRPGCHRFKPNDTLIYSLLLGVCYTSPVAGHDFWVQPSEYWLKPQVVTPITLQVGHGPYRQRSPIPLDRIKRFEAITPSGTIVDLRSNLHPGGNTEDGNFRVRDPGAYLLVLETDARAQSHLPSIRFNDYLEVEGLTPALEQRKRTHRMDSDGSESYSRRAKAIVQLGPPGAGSQALVTQPLGLPLEIVPEHSPYTQPRPATLPVRVIYEGRPLAGALVKLTNLEHDAVPFEIISPHGSPSAVYQRGARLSMNACTPSNAVSSIMLQAIVCPAASYAASMLSSAWR